MGCVCCSLSSFVSILLDAFERVSLCTVCAMLTCCLLLTILTVMVLGIGIGFHYCFVQSSVEAMEKAAQASRGGQDGGEAVRTIDKAMKKSLSAHRVKRREADTLYPSNNNNLSYNNTLMSLLYPPNYAYFNITDYHAVFNNNTYLSLNTTNLTVASF